MAKKNKKALVIVESPAKARTLTGFLGPGYEVRASIGHVRDLPKSQLGVDIEDDFLPKYLVPKEKQAVVRELKKAAEGGGQALPGDRPRPRGGGDRLARDPGGRAREDAPSARRLPRGDGRRRPPRLPPSPRDRQAAGGRAAGPPRPRPPRRLQDQPAALEEGPSRAIGGPRPVGGPANGGRARAGDHRLPAPGVLDHRRQAGEGGRRIRRRGVHRPTGRPGRKAQEA